MAMPESHVGVSENVARERFWLMVRAGIYALTGLTVLLALLLG